MAYHHPVQLLDMRWRQSLVLPMTICALAYFPPCICLLRCHLGKVIKYDTVEKWGWPVDLRSHSIRTVIEQVLAEDWEAPSDDASGRQVPELGDEEGCIVSSQ